MILLIVQSLRFADCHLPAREATIDPLFLIGLALIDDRRARLRMDRGN